MRLLSAVSKCWGCLISLGDVVKANLLIVHMILQVTLCPECVNNTNGTGWPPFGE